MLEFMMYVLMFLGLFSLILWVGTKEGSEYYILSLKHLDDVDNMFTWWRPDNKGYTSYLNNAGKYTQREIDEHPDYYNNTQVVALIQKHLLPHHPLHKVQLFLLA